MSKQKHKRWSDCFLGHKVRKWQSKDSKCVWPDAKAHDPAQDRDARKGEEGLGRMGIQHCQMLQKHFREHVPYSRTVENWKRSLHLTTGKWVMTSQWSYHKRLTEWINGEQMGTIINNSIKIQFIARLQLYKALYVINVYIHYKYVGTYIYIYVYLCTHRYTYIQYYFAEVILQQNYWAW